MSYATLPKCALNFTTQPDRQSNVPKIQPNAFLVTTIDRDIDNQDSITLFFGILIELNLTSLVGLAVAVINLGNCWRLAGSNDVATHINIAVCYVAQLYKSILTYSIQLAWNLAIGFF